MTVLLGQLSHTGTNTVFNPNPDQLYTYKWTAVAGGTPVKFKLDSSAAGQPTKVAIYAADGTSGNPGTLLYQGNATTVTGVNTIALTAVGTPGPIVSGTLYWIGIMQDNYNEVFQTSKLGTPWAVDNNYVAFTDAVHNPYQRSTGGSTDVPMAIQVESDAVPTLTDSFVADESDAALANVSVNWSVHTPSTMALIDKGTATITSGELKIESSSMAWSTQYRVVVWLTDDTKARSYLSSTGAQPA